MTFFLSALEIPVQNATAVLIALAICGCGLMALLWRRPRLRGTTLMASWYWSLATLLSLAGTELAIALAGAEASWSAPLWYIAAMGTFTPIMALLGAKRPQDRGWQLIVLSLWAILSLPAFEWLLFGGVAEIHPARFWFLLILILVGATNGIGTRHWASSLLYCAGQVLLLLPYFTFEHGPADVRFAGGLLLLSLAWLLLAVTRPARREATPLDRVWLDFRDAFGVVWALRIAERMNTSARMYDWPVTLGWSGFQPRAEDTASLDRIDVPPALEDSLRTLLRRFVSPEWIDARLGGETAPGSEPAETTASTR